MNNDAEPTRPHDEPIDLLELTRDLMQRLPGRHADYLGGKTAMRDIVMEGRGCSSLEAETIVDTLEARGFIVFDETAGDQRWRFEPHR